ncbi:nickel/cobalt transporter [Mesorhizobium sp. CN2-181]|uniref:nickel/cobalt transporter n=1 Tax=Mesorhizobium yinganensis TaxID=3157707 RepID=UPI0032B7E9F1
MTKPTLRTVLALLGLAAVTAHFAAAAHAQSSLGIGTNEAMVPSTGLFSGFMNWVNVQQQGFYRSLTGALKAMRQDGGQLWILVGLSFAYGVFHAAGPGHGKAVISSYMLANEVALRRGIMLSFVSAFLQALTAIIVMTLVFLVLRGTAISMTDATWFLEIASYALITLFGAWLLWTKAWPRLSGLFGLNPAFSLSAAQADSPAGNLFGPIESPAAPRFDHAFVASDASAPGTVMVCETCGHSHAPDPSMISGDRFDWRTAWSAVVAVGLRPCTGALIVLSFAFLNGLFAGGILSVVAMSVGTAITVSLLATLAVTAKNWAVTFAGDGRTGNRVHASIEIAGALLVFLLGLALLGASLNA